MSTSRTLHFHITYTVTYVAIRDMDDHEHLHRDISTGNIILVDQEGSDLRNGALIDFEFGERYERDKDRKQVYIARVSQ